MLEDVMSQPAPDVEIKTLLRYLNSQRDHALGILEGLDEAALRRSLLPSGWNCLGLVQHLALDIERFWFRCVVAGEQEAIRALADTANAWQIGTEVPAGAVFDRYRQEIALANAILGATPLDAAPAWWPPELFGNWRLHTVREVILHVMTETACHAGHLDTARELIDGRLWMVMTD
jgi:hypothetical protein